MCVLGSQRFGVFVLFVEANLMFVLVRGFCWSGIVGGEGCW